MRKPLETSSTQAGPQLPSEPMGFFIRLFALVTDLLILFAFDSLLVFLFGRDIAVGIAWFAHAGYFTLFTALRGQTPGKMVFRIAVVTTADGEMGIARAAIREVMGKVVAFPLAPLLLGHFFCLFDDNKQSWFDKMVGTYVVKRT